MAVLAVFLNPALMKIFFIGSVFRISPQVNFVHFVIAIVFIGALRDPVRNAWLFDFGLIACAFVIPYALIFGAIRGIPFWWRLIDCSFGIGGFIPLWLCKQWTRELSGIEESAPTI